MFTLLVVFGLVLVLFGFWLRETLQLKGELEEECHRLRRRAEDAEFDLRWLRLQLAQAQAQLEPEPEPEPEEEMEDW